jgi:hypothetical protein
MDEHDITIRTAAGREAASMHVSMPEFVVLA